MQQCPNKSKNNEKCNCSYPGCARHGLCCECIAHHRAHQELPACYFSAEAEKTYDRSLAGFIISFKK